MPDYVGGLNLMAGETAGVPNNTPMAPPRPGLNPQAGAEILRGAQGQDPLRQMWSTMLDPMAILQQRAAQQQAAQAYRAQLMQQQDQSFYESMPRTAMLDAYANLRPEMSGSQEMAALAAGQGRGAWEAEKLRLANADARAKGMYDIEKSQYDQLQQDVATLPKLRDAMKPWKDFHVGNELVRVNEDGSVQVLHGNALMMKATEDAVKEMKAAGFSFSDPEAFNTELQRRVTAKLAQLRGDYATGQPAAASPAIAKSDLEVARELAAKEAASSGQPVDVRVGDVAETIQPAAVTQAASTTAAPSAFSDYITPPSARRKPVGVSVQDKVAEDVYKAGAEEANKQASKRYTEDVVAQADAAGSMLNTIQGLKMIPWRGDRLNDIKMNLGSWVAALPGMKGTDVEKNVGNLRDAQRLMVRIANDSLRLNKGVQTEGDAQRAFNEFAKITDPDASAKFALRWAEAQAKRTMQRQQFYDEYAGANQGTYQNAEQGWKQYIKNAPLVVQYGGQTVFQNEWLDAYKRKNPQAGDREALAAWVRVAGGK